MADMITRCPKCSTAFRVSEAHLQSAKGMVRCGKCLEVFNAQDHIKSQPVTQPAAKAPLSPSAPAVPKAPSSNPTNKTPVSSKARSTRSTGVLDSTQSDEGIDDDEAWALELLKDDSDLNIQLKKIVTQEEKAKEPHKRSAMRFFSEPPERKKTTIAQPQTPPPENGTSATSTASAKDMVAAIEPEVLEVSWEDAKARRKKKLKWVGLCTAAGIALTAQVLWLEFYRLAKVQPYRTVYQTVCKVTGCTLPILKNHTAIKTSNLMIRSHPTERGALMVDFVLQNSAHFEQPFPNLLLAFTNLKAEQVAARRFLPEDYLGGELAGVHLMPMRQPIHIAIEIKDPGLSALSYHIAVVD